MESHPFLFSLYTILGIDHQAELPYSVGQREREDIGFKEPLAIATFLPGGNNKNAVEETRFPGLKLLFCEVHIPTKNSLESDTSEFIKIRAFDELYTYLYNS